MEDNGVEHGHHNGMDTDDHQNGVMNGHTNGSSHHHSSKHKHKDKKGEKRKETEEERRIRKEKERKERSKNETEEERAIRKEKERKEREERHKKEGKRPETEEERRIRKEKERSSQKKDGKRPETEEERAIRKEKERKEKEERYKKEGKRPETEEERRIRKEKEKQRGKETEEERRERKERERRERKEREKVKEEIKEEPMDESSAQDDESQEEIDVKEEPQDEEEEEIPIKKSKKSRKSYKEEPASDDDAGDEDFKAEPESDEEPAPKKKSKKRKHADSDDEEEDFKPAKKSKKPAKKQAPPPPPPKSKAKIKQEAPSPTKKGGKVKKEEEKQEVWKWWEEDQDNKKKDDGTKWYFLEHQGPLFAPAYEPLPESVRFYYDGKKMHLSEETEEVATFYGKMLDHDYTTKEVFNKNFFKDWRRVMTEKEKEKIRDLSKCDFSEINVYFKKVSEERKARSKEEKKAEKLKNDELTAYYGICTIDGHKEKIGNFRIEPPGLFRGRGEHPKQGMHKRRVMPEDVIVNCSKDSEIPEPPEGHRWKEVRHDNTVTWLASWTENIQNQIKYVMLNPASKLKGEKDMQKYEKARMLKTKIDKIREAYVNDFKSKEMRVRQRAVAMYFIDKLALRAGNEKDEDQADTVGCCSLRVEHITLHEEKDGKDYVVEFDFLGKDSIQYHNDVAVEKRVFKNLTLFKEGKKTGDDLFDRLNTSILNEHLTSLMPGLTAKVFRTYNASITLQEQLKELTDEDDNLAAKVLSYNRANRAVAVLCNHQRAVPKTHDKSMGTLKEKIELKREAVEKAEKEFKDIKKQYKKGGSEASKVTLEKKKKAVERAMEQLNKLETQAVDKEENKTIALGTSKLNYLDPRISVAWCKKFDVPLEKVYTKTHRDKFRWAIEMIQSTDEEYEF